MKVRFKNVLIFLSTALAITAITTPAFAQSHPVQKKCAFYEHFDYQGKSFQLHDGHVLTVDKSFKVGPDFTKKFDYQRFDAPEWAHSISSNKTAKGCQALVVASWEKNVWVGDVPRYDATYNDKAVAVGCRCK